MPLYITIRFLTGRAHLHHWHAHHSDGKVDWPPAPWRLLRALVAAAGTGLTSLPEPLDESITDTADDPLPVSRLADILAMLTASPKIWLPRTGGGHTRQFLPKEFKSTGSAVFDTFATVSKETPIVFEWPEADVTTGDARFIDLQTLLRRLTYFGRAESWCDATAHTERPPELKPDVSHWCCLALETGVKPNGREHVDYTLEQKLTPCSGPSLPEEATSLLTRLKRADANENSVEIDNQNLLGSFPLNSFVGRLVVRPAPTKKRNAGADPSEDSTTSKAESKRCLLIAIGPWTENERDALLKRPDLEGEATKAAKKALSDVLKKRVAATTQSLTWREELKRNSESTGGLLLLRCLLRSSGEDIKDGLERPIGSRWIHYAIPRAIHRLPQDRVAPHPKRAEPLITLARFALNTATVNRPVLPLLADTLLFADKFRAAALAWHGHLKSSEHPRNLCGRERNDTSERRIEGHNHAFFWPTDEDNDGFIDHMLVYCSHGFLTSEANALRRLLRIRQRGGRPDLLVTPVFLGDAADFGPWKSDATVFVSATPYYCPVNLSHGKNSGGKVRSIAKEILRSLRLTNVVQTEAEVAGIHEIVFNDTADVCPATWPHSDLSDARYRTAWLKPPDESFIPGTLAGLRLDGGTRLLRALAFFRRRRCHVIEGSGRMFRIEFTDARSSQPFALGSQCHFGLGQFVPVATETVQ
jgi:hypothetical protein